MQMYLEIPGMMTLMGGSQAWPVSVPHIKNHIRDEGDETDASGIGAKCDVMWVLLVELQDRTTLEEALRHREALSSWQNFLICHGS